jgi:hypothetical protein
MNASLATSGLTRAFERFRRRQRLPPGLLDEMPNAERMTGQVVGCFNYIGVIMTLRSFQR